MTEKYLTPEDVADWLSVKPRKVMDMARDGELPAYKVGKDWRFSREEVSAYLRTMRNQSPTEGQHV